MQKISILKKSRLWVFIILVSLMGLLWFGQTVKAASCLFIDLLGQTQCVRTGLGISMTGDTAYIIDSFDGKKETCESDKVNGNFFADDECKVDPGSVGVSCHVSGHCLKSGEVYKISEDLSINFDGTPEVCRKNGGDFFETGNCTGKPVVEQVYSSPLSSELNDHINSLDKLGAPNFNTVISRIIMVVMGGTGAIALAMFVFGGFLWMTAAGNAEREKKAFEVLVWTGLGLIVILSSYAILNFVFSIFV